MCLPEKPPSVVTEQFLPWGALDYTVCKRHMQSFTKLKIIQHLKEVVDITIKQMKKSTKNTNKKTLRRQEAKQERKQKTTDNLKM